jgi:hypothetical protein
MSMRHFCQTVIGMVLAATPLALWIARSPTQLLATVLVAVLGAGLLVMLTDETSERAAEQGPRLPEEFLVEVQHLHPMIHHHSGRRSSRFQRTMRRLAQLTPPTRG